MDDSIDTDPPASPQSGSSSGYAASSSASDGWEPVIGPWTRPPSPPETPRETRLMIAALASGELKPTPEVLEKLRQYEVEGERRDYERYAWVTARDEARARAEAAGVRGRCERAVAHYGYDHNLEASQFQDDARMSRKRARGEASASAPASGRGGLVGTSDLHHEARDKSVLQAKELIQIDGVGLAKPVLGLGTELPDRSRFRTKQLYSVHVHSQIMPEVPEKMMHYEEGPHEHQDYAKVDQVPQAWQEASAGAMAGGCQHERMMLYEEALQEFKEFERLHKASFSATAGGGLDKVGGVMDQKMMDGFVKQAARMQGMVEALTPHVFSKELVYAPMLEFVGRYPKWLGANRDKLSKQEYEQYERQLELMVNLTVIYENEPQNFSRIVNIMQRIQESGMPPNDIVVDIFPGLDLNSMRQRFPGILGQSCCIL